MGAFLFLVYLIGLPVTLFGTIKYIWSQTSYWGDEEYIKLFFVTVLWPLSVPVCLTWIGCAMFFPWLVEKLGPSWRRR